MRFFDDVGKMGLGSRIRFLGEKIGAEAAEIYRAYGTNLNPKWFPVFYVLSKSEKNNVTSIASYIGHSHASVSKIIGEMSRAGLVIERTDTKDRRSTVVGLTKKGKEIAGKMELQCADVILAIEELSSQATHNLWEALQEWSYLLDQKSLRDRVLDQKKRRESAEVKIEPYQAKYQEAFRKFNEEWITTHFKMEKPDHQALDNPRKYILDRGGFIFVATIDNAPVGVCALLWRNDLKTYELAKMAVAKGERGKNIGFMLGKAAIDKAKSQKAERVFLESNTILKPAIKLYEKLGFKKIVGPPTPYERCNIQMELRLDL
jgi:DNA-binding MarR family transcriptional regulator/predicted N-acetyltransferase YhbS